MNAILKMSVFIFPLITFPYVSRVLTATGTGRVQFATSLISYFTLFAQLGIPTYGIRICARVRDDREKLTQTVQEIFLLSLITTIVSYAALAAVLLTVPRLQGDRTLYLVVSLNIFFTFIGVEWFYRALEQYTYITIRSLIFKVIGAVAMFLLIHDPDDYVIYGGITVFAGTASYICNFINLRRYIDLRPRKSFNLKRHLKPILVFFAMSCATTIYTHLDTVMLGFMTTDADVGYYGAAVKIKTILVSLVTSLGTVLLPRASYYVQCGAMEEFRRVTAKSLRFVLMMAAPLSLYFMLFARYGIRFLSGSGYDGAIMPMILIMPTLLLIGISNVTGMQILVPTGRERYVLYSEIAGAVIDIIINFALIPTMKSSGAAIGTVAAEIVVCLVQILFVRKELAPIVRKICFWKPALALLLAIPASIWIWRLHLNNFLTLAISAVCFFGVYGAVLLIAREQLVMELFHQAMGMIGKRLHRTGNKK